MTNVPKRSFPLLRKAGCVFVRQPVVPLVPGEVFVKGRALFLGSNLCFAHISKEFRIAFFGKRRAALGMSVARTPGKSYLLKLYDVMADTRDEQIKEVLSNPKEVEVTLDDWLIQFIRAAAGDRVTDCALIANQRHVCNLGFVRDIRGNLRPVSARFVGDGLMIDVDEVTRFAFTRFISYSNIIEIEEETLDEVEDEVPDETSGPIQIHLKKGDKRPAPPAPPTPSTPKPRTGPWV